jgi:hypothetical protein
MKNFKIINHYTDKSVYVSVKRSQQKDLKYFLIYFQFLMESETEISVHIKTEGLVEAVKKYINIKKARSLKFCEDLNIYDLRLINEKKIQKIKDNILNNQEEKSLILLLSNYIQEKDIKEKYYKKIQQKYKIELF